MPQGGYYGLLFAHADHAAAPRVLHPRLGRVPLEPVERAPDRPVVGLHDALVVADERSQGDGLESRKRQVTVRMVVDPAVPRPAAEPPLGAVRHHALQHRLECAGVDRAFKAELGCSRPVQALAARCSGESFA